MNSPCLRTMALPRKRVNIPSSFQLPKLYRPLVMIGRNEASQVRVTWHEVERGAMSTTLQDLSSEIRHFSAEMKRLEQRLKSEPTPDPAALNELRHAVDNMRLTAWSVSELINAERIKKNPDTVLAFLSSERLRRFDQLVKSLCADIERGLITVQTHGMQS